MSCLFFFLHDIIPLSDEDIRFFGFPLQFNKIDFCVKCKKFYIYNWYGKWMTMKEYSKIISIVNNRQFQLAQIKRDGSWK